MSNPAQLIPPVFAKINMAHGLRIHSKDRLAVSEFRNRAITEWNKPDGTAPIGVDTNNRVDNIQNEEEEEGNEGRIAIELLRAETASDDLLSRKDLDIIEFLSETSNSLKSMVPVLNDEQHIRSISNSDAECLLHVNQVEEPNIEGTTISLFSFLLFIF